MNEASRKSLPNFEGLPNITFRQLEVFRMICREGSYANAAVELHSTRANIKRLCDDFEKAVGASLFTEDADRTLHPTPFAMGLLDQMGPLSRGLRRLGECVRDLHEGGRVLRFAAAGEFFKGGLFTEFLSRLHISDAFRPCFLRIDMKRMRNALMNAECDVYFGLGLTTSDRLDLIHLGDVPWRIEHGPRYSGDIPTRPADLPSGKWSLTDGGSPDAAAELLEVFHQAGARNGRIHPSGEPSEAKADHIHLVHDITRRRCAEDQAWPCFRFSALMRKLHPYSELPDRLKNAAAH